MVDRKHDEDDVGVVVRQRPEPVKVLLAGRVPERELDELTLVLYMGDKVLSCETERDIQRGRLRAPEKQRPTSKTVGT